MSTNNRWAALASAPAPAPATGAYRPPATRSWASTPAGDTPSTNPFSGGGRSAFGGSEEEQKRREERKRQHEEAQAREAREAAERRREEAAATKKHAEATNFASEEFYPSLGAPKKGPAGFAPALAQPMRSFKATVEAMKEREEREAADARLQAERDAADAARRATLGVAVRVAPAPARQSRWDRYMDDSDDEEQETGDDIGDGPVYAPPPDDEEDDGEFNADTVRTARRGDKGIW